MPAPEPSLRVEMIEVETWSLLKRDLPRGSLVLGKEDHAALFFTVRLFTPDGEHVMGVVCSQDAVRPRCVVKGNRAYLGFNMRLAVIKPVDGLLHLHQVELSTLFWEFLSLPELADVIILGETAVVAISAAGDHLWRQDTDLIADFRVEGTVLHLDRWGKPPLTIDLAQGARSKDSTR